MEYLMQSISASTTLMSPSLMTHFTIKANQLLDIVHEFRPPREQEQKGLINRAVNGQGEILSKKLTAWSFTFLEHIVI